MYGAKKVLFLTRFSPSPTGHGGNHRSFQVLQDLQRAAPDSQVEVLVNASHNQPEAEITQGRLALLNQKLQERLTLLWQYIISLGSPYKLESYIFNHVLPRLDVIGVGGLESYQAYLEQNGIPDLVFLEDLAFDPVLQQNLQLGIPTICCPQNLETFDRYNLNLKVDWNQYGFVKNLLRELKYLGSCNERLLISKMETALAAGLDLPSHYYPYLPTGEVRISLMGIRRIRATREPEAGFFLLLGTAGHIPHMKSMQAFVAQVSKTGLPQGVRVMVVGMGTEKLAISEVPAEMEFKGWVEQAELDELLTRVRGVLAPKSHGFGAMTRLPELSCAGVPVIASANAVYAINTPPGVFPAEEKWDDWMSKICFLNEVRCDSDLSEYEHWEINQPKPLAAIVSEYLNFEKT